VVGIADQFSKLARWQFSLRVRSRLCLSEAKFGIEILGRREPAALLKSLCGLGAGLPMDQIFFEQDRRIEGAGRPRQRFSDFTSSKVGIALV
jgi:hypothetical protein